MGIKRDARSSWHSAIVEMFEIDLTKITGDNNDKFYFTANLMPDGSKVIWKNKTYEPLPMQADGFETSTKGQLPQPQLTVANVLGTLAAVVNSFDDLVGAKVTRRRTLGKYLDTGPNADPSQEFPEDEFYIERKVAETSVSITWQLSSKIDLEGLQLPRRIITQNYCIWKYRGPECNYDGPPVANEFDMPLIDDGSSEAGTAYIEALDAYSAASALRKQKQATKNRLLEEKNLACDPTLAKSQGSFFVFSDKDSSYQEEQGGPTGYTFIIENTDGKTIAAVYDNNKINLNAAEPQYRAGLKIRTNRGPGGDGNGTGSLFRVDLWDQTPDGPVLVSSSYNIDQGTFGLRDLSGNKVFLIQGAVVIQPPGGGFSAYYDLGSKMSSGFAPMRAVEKIKYDIDDCNDAEVAFEAARDEYEAALAAEEAARDVVFAAYEALPDNDSLMRQDRCGKRLQSCKLRFGIANALPFGGFPGATLTR